MTTTVSHKSPVANHAEQGAQEQALIARYQEIAGTEDLRWRTRYRKLHLLGTGGQGAVYLAHRLGANGFARPVGGEREPQPSGPFMRSAPSPAPRPAVPNHPAGPANGDQRGRLHLSLGNGPPAHNNGAPALEPRPPERPYAPAAPQPAPQGAGERGPWSPAPQQRSPGPADQTRYGPASTGSPEPTRTDQPGGYGRGDGHPAQRKEGNSTYIDQELRTRVDGDIAAFLTAFDAALAEDTQESRAALREATDRLLRAGARTRIELERLEARMPLPPRDGGRQSEPVWRQR